MSSPARKFAGAAPAYRKGSGPSLWVRIYAKRARRVATKIEFHFGGLFLRLGFIVTNLAAQNRAVARFYNKRDTAEQWIKEGKRRSR
jgi:hypothetical protein